ncbi:MAG: ABC transporter permease [Methylacidiphilales bacterium]|nr:ABC transporter permease [Candidatus Methylacidiphilales bacterium]
MKRITIQLPANWYWYAYALVIVFILYLPLLGVGLASFSADRYIHFPITDYSVKWYGVVLQSEEIANLTAYSLAISAIVSVASMVFAFFGALAFTRYQWWGRSWYQKFILIPIFFPQYVLGLSMLLYFNAIGITPSWQTTIIAHLVWIAPIATLIVVVLTHKLDPALEEAAKVLGASHPVVLREITFPLLLPAIVTAGIFAFLLSWGNLALTLFTSGVDNTLSKWMFTKIKSAYDQKIPTLGILSMVFSALAMALFFIFIKIWGNINKKYSNII